MLLSTLTLSLLLPVAAASAQRDRESAYARRETRQGRILPLKEIERRVVPTMPNAQYIGFNLDMDAAVYTLKFLRNGAVIWVDVDGRSGAVIGKTGD